MSATKKRAVARQAKMARLEARVSSDQKRLFERAADLQGRSLTEFVIRSMQKAAQETIREHELMSLTARDTKAFVNALLKPPASSARLKRAAERYQALMEG
jgi:uncharacterized protein (DUF1778 family)